MEMKELFKWTISLSKAFDHEIIKYQTRSQTSFSSLKINRCFFLLAFSEQFEQHFFINISLE